MFFETGYFCLDTLFPTLYSWRVVVLYFVLIGLMDATKYERTVGVRSWGHGFYFALLDLYLFSYRSHLLLNDDEMQAIACSCTVEILSFAFHPLVSLTLLQVCRGNSLVRIFPCSVTLCIVPKCIGNNFWSCSSVLPFPSSTAFVSLCLLSCSYTCSHIFIPSEETVKFLYHRRAEWVFLPGDASQV